MDFVSGMAKKVQSDPSSDDQPNKPSNPDLFSSAKVVAGAAQSQFRSEEYDKTEDAGAWANLLGAASEYGKLDDTQGVGKYADQAEGYLRKYGSGGGGGAADESTETKISESDGSAPAKTLAVDGGDSDAPAGGGDYSELKSAAAFTDTDDLKSSLTDAVGDSDDVKTKTKDSSAAIDDFTSDIKTAIPTTDDATTDADKPSGGVGGYIKKAEGFLSKPTGDGETEDTGENLKKPSEGALKPSEAAGDYLKEAEDVLKKPSGVDGEKTEAPSETQSGGGFGNVMKMAGGFPKK